MSLLSDGMQNSILPRLAALSGFGIFFLPTAGFALDSTSPEAQSSPSPTTVAQTTINPGTGQPIYLPGSASNTRLPGGRANGLASSRIVLPNASRLDDFSRLNPQLGLSQRLRFSTLSSFKQKAPQIRALKLGNASLNFATYANSRNSFSSLSSRISPYAIPSSVSGQVRLLSNTNKSVAIVESITYQPKFSTCSSSPKISRASAIATRELCFSRLSRRSTKTLSSPKVNSQIQSLKAELKKATSNKSSAKIPAWARSLDSAQLEALSKYTNKQLSQVIANNAKIKRVRTIIGANPGLSKSRVLELSSAACRAGSCNFRATNRSQDGSTKTRNGASPRISDGTYKVDEKIYLTGFTFAESFYWTEVWEAELDYGLDTSHVVIAPYAEAYYGLGARFPLNVKTDLTVKDNGTKAELGFNITPINANSNQLLATGLPPQYIFSGKELVAEVGASAGVTYTLPIIGQGGLGPWSTKIDFTTKLPSPLTGGNFTPPSATPVRLGAPIIFNTVDLLVGSGNLYVENVGGASFVAHPGLSLGLRSPDRGISVVDMKDSNKSTRITSRNRKAMVKLDRNQNAKFEIKDPFYNLSLFVYPGMQLKGTIGLLGWDKPVSKYINFPSLGIDIPSRGIPFGCHAGTICSRTYSFKAGRASEGPTKRDPIYNHTIKLSKNYRIRDDEVFKDEFYNRNVTEKPQTVQRPIAGRGPVDATIKRHAQRNSPRRCAGGEVRGEDWDRIEVDSNGVARMWVSIDLYEGTRCSTDDLDGTNRGVTPEGRPRGNAFLEVQPGRTGTKELRVNNTAEGGDYVRIIYTLKNEYRRIN